MKENNVNQHLEQSLQPLKTFKGPQPALDQP